MDNIDTDLSETRAPARPVATGTLLQRIVTTRRASIRPLYWRAFRHPNDGAGAFQADLRGDGGIDLSPGTTLGFDTYFGAFFEANWWTRTALDAVELRVSVRGPCTVRVHRRIGDAVHLLEQAVVSAPDPDDRDPHRALRFVVRAETASFRQHGLLFLELAADRGAPARLVEASWHATAPAAPVSLAVVICTFRRERWLGDVLAAAVSEPEAEAAFDRVIVVDQGAGGDEEGGNGARGALRRHPAVAPAAAALGARLRVVEQDNLGGAGGFTRGIVEALDDPSLSHVLLLDDDIDLEPEVLVRINAFLARADRDVALGGHMLDRVQPMRLYEGGAVFEPQTWFVRPVQHDLDLRSADVLAEIATPPAAHYNGWWCFAIALDLVRANGLPLPVFLRGDDAEYGVRLGLAGVRTVSVPGIAVWHEPFYLKLGSWHLYYETRNLLVLAALHRDATGPALARRQLRQFLLHLLTYRYDLAGLILRGIEDFLAGPAVLDGDPGIRHRALVSAVAPRPGERVSRHEVLEELRPPRLPRGAPGYLACLLLVLFRSALVPARPVDRRLGVHDFAWVSLRRADSVVLDNWWEEAMPVYRRSRARFLSLSGRAIRTLARLLRHGPAAAAAWREAAPALAALETWRARLDAGTGPRAR